MKNGKKISWDGVKLKLKKKKERKRKTDFILNPDKRDPIRDASDPTLFNISHAEIRQCLFDISGCINNASAYPHVHAAPFTGDSVCGLITQKSFWKRDEGAPEFRLSWDSGLPFWSYITQTPNTLASFYIDCFHFPKASPALPSVFICFILFVFSN